MRLEPTVSARASNAGSTSGVTGRTIARVPSPGDGRPTIEPGSKPPSARRQNTRSPLSLWTSTSRVPLPSIVVALDLDSEARVGQAELVRCPDEAPSVVRHERDVRARRHQVEIEPPVAVQVLDQEVRHLDARQVARGLEVAPAEVPRQREAALHEPDEVGPPVPVDVHETGGAAGFGTGDRQQGEGECDGLHGDLLTPRSSGSPAEREHSARRCHDS